MSHGFAKKSALIDDLVLSTGARVDDPGAQTIPDASSTKLQFGTVIRDDENYFSDADDWFVIPSDGWYVINANIRWDENQTVDRYIASIEATTAGRLFQWDFEVNTTDNLAHHEHPVTTIAYLTAGDTVYIDLFQTNTGAAAVGLHADTYFAIAKLSPVVHGTTSGAAVEKSGNQTITTGVTTDVTWDTTLRDDGGYFDDANDRFDIPSTGWYIVNAVVQWGSGSTGKRSVHFTDSDSELWGLTEDDAATSSPRQNLSAIVYWTAGDWVKLQCSHTEGSDVTVLSGQSNFSIAKLSSGRGEDHGSLSGLADDDHTQYFLADGTRNVSGGITFDEIAEPSAPSANDVVLWAEDNQGFSILAWKDSSGESHSVGQDSYLIVRNNTGAQIDKGKAVYINGSTGTVPTIALADASSASTLPAVGLVDEDIADNSFGRVVTFGAESGFDTSAFLDGDEVYVSTTAGGLTTTPPTLAQRVGVVITANLGNGVVFVSPGGVQDDALVDHGLLTGLGDDDHTQYLNDTRHNESHSMLRARRLTSAQSISDATVTTLIFNSITSEDDEDGDFTLNTSTGVLTINNAGWYRFDAGALFATASNSSSRMIVRIKVNSTVIAQVEARPGTTADWSHQVSTAYDCSASDTVEVEVYNDDLAGAARDISADARTFLVVEKVRE